MTAYLLFIFFFLLEILLVADGQTQTTDIHIASGDSLAASFRNGLALREYEKAYALDPDDCTVRWKLAEVYVNLGEEAQGSKQKQLYLLAEKWALQTVKDCPLEKNGHFFVAVTNGLLALGESGRQRIKRSYVVREQALKTIALDSLHHGAYHVLGRWNREVAGLSWLEKAAAKIIYGGVPPGASYEKAVKYFRKAIAISPNWINHHKELGITYMAMGNWSAAKTEFETVLRLPVTDHRDDFHKAQARRYLRQIQVITQ